MWECRGFVDLLPRAVQVEQAEGDADAVVEVWAEEARAIADVVPQRRTEFGITRTCARRALQRLGVEPHAIPVGVDREPVWPRGVVGSLTHGAGLHAAAVALKTSVRAIGIDVEANRSLPCETLNLVAGPAEMRALDSLASKWPEVAWDRLLFSAKEAIFKAWFPATGRWLGFTDCVLTIEPRTATFTGRLPPGDGPGAAAGHSVVEGRWGVGGQRLLTAAVLATR